MKTAIVLILVYFYYHQQSPASSRHYRVGGNPGFVFMSTLEVNGRSLLTAKTLHTDCMADFDWNLSLLFGVLRIQLILP